MCWGSADWTALVKSALDGLVWLDFERVMLRYLPRWADGSESLTVDGQEKVNVGENQ